MNTTDAFKYRQSNRDFTNEKVSDEILKKLTEAALYAPVGLKKYAELRITVITNEALLQKIDENCRRVPDVSPLHNAPALILVSCATEDEALANQNVACMIDHMLIAASELGLASLYVKGICPPMSKNEEIKRALNIPAGYTPIASAAIGYPVTKITPREKPKNDATVIEYIR